MDKTTVMNVRQLTPQQLSQLREDSRLYLNDYDWLGHEGELIYIGRKNDRWGLSGSYWANPFKMHGKTDAERQRVIVAYEKWLWQQPDLVWAIREELRGKALVCWCAPLACHGDVLAKYANMSEEEWHALLPEHLR